MRGGEWVKGKEFGMTPLFFGLSEYNDSAGILRSVISLVYGWSCVCVRPFQSLSVPQKTHCWLIFYFTCVWLCPRQRSLISHTRIWYACRWDLFIWHNGLGNYKYPEVTHINSDFQLLLQNQKSYQQWAKIPIWPPLAGTEHQLSLSAFRAGWFSRWDGVHRFLHSLGASHVCVGMSSPALPHTLASPRALWSKFASVLWHLNAGSSVSQIQVLILVPLVKMMVLELVLRECKEVQGKEGNRRGQPKLVTCSINPLESYHVAFLVFLRLNVTQDLSAFEVQDCHLYYFAFIGKLWKPSLLHGEGGLNLAFLQGREQRRYSPSICPIQLLNCILSVRGVSASKSLQRIKNLNKRLTVRMNQFLFLLNGDFWHFQTVSRADPVFRACDTKAPDIFKAAGLEKKQSSGSSLF